MRLRWTDPHDDPWTWQMLWMVTAPIFLNFLFFFGVAKETQVSRSHLTNSIFAIAFAVVITLGFFVAPSGETRSNPLIQTLKTVFASVYVAVLASTLGTLVSWQLPWLIRRDVNNVQSTLIFGVIVAFLFATAAQPSSALSRLGWFSTRLGIAVLVAAFIRVRHSVPNEFNPSSWTAANIDYAYVYDLVFSTAPLLFLASHRGDRAAVRKAAVPIAATLALTLIAIDILDAAVLTSGFYRPSVYPNIAMALWGNANFTGVRTGMAVALLSTFGSIRFMIASLRALSRSRLVMGACFVCIVAYPERWIETAKLLQFAGAGLMMLAIVDIFRRKPKLATIPGN